MADSMNERISEAYNAALKTALSRYKEFFKLVKAIEDGKIKPPNTAKTDRQIRKWKQEFINAAAREQDVIRGIAQELAKVGVDVSEQIKDAMAKTYQLNYKSVGDKVGMSFTMPNTRTVRAILEDREGVFSQLAYANMGNDTIIRRRLQQELAQATILGDSQKVLIGRIRKVTGQSEAQARRVAQTERTRVQSMGRFDGMKEASARGVVMEKEWSARIRDSREAHIFLDGARVPEDDPFVVDDANDVLYKGKKGAKTGGGYTIMYPGDPNAPARAVINCRCVMIPRVLKPGETPQNNQNIQIPSQTVIEEQTAVAEQKPIAETNVGERVKLDVSQWPSAFNKKQTAAYMDYVNSLENADPEAIEMLSLLGKMDTGETLSVTYRPLDSKISTRTYSSTGNIYDIRAYIPKFDADLPSTASTITHELTHLINEYARSGAAYGSYTNGKGVIAGAKASFTGMSERVRKMFIDARVSADQSTLAVNANYNAQIKNINNQISDALTARDYHTYSTLAKQRDRLYKERDIAQDRANREAVGGVAAMMDIYDAISGGTYRDKGWVMYGHGSKYYGRDSNLADDETFSNWMDLQINHPDLAKVLAEELPEVDNGMRDILHGIVNGAKNK